MKPWVTHHTTCITDATASIYLSAKTIDQQSSVHFFVSMPLIHQRSEIDYSTLLKHDALYSLTILSSSSKVPSPFKQSIVEYLSTWTESGTIYFVAVKTQLSHKGAFTKESCHTERWCLVFLSSASFNYFKTFPLITVDAEAPIENSFVYVIHQCGRTSYYLKAP